MTTDEIEAKLDELYALGAEIDVLIRELILSKQQTEEKKDDVQTVPRVHGV